MDLPLRPKIDRVKRSLRIALCFGLIVSPAAATDYFVSAIGDDGLAGTSPATAWASMARVQQAQAFLQPGDQVLFRAGDRFEGSLVLTCSGIQSAPIVLGRYGIGAAPCLVASDEVTGWVAAGGGVWTAPNPTGAVHPEALFVNGRPEPLGREPDARDPDGGYRTIDASVGHTVITDFDLSNTPNWTGAEVVVRTQRWILDRVRVQSHSGSSVALAGPGTFPYPIQPAFGFFMQDHPSALDQHLEWCFMSAGQALQIFLDAGSTPADYALRTPKHAHVIQLIGNQDLRIEGLELNGARDALVSGSQTTRVTLDDCRLGGCAGDGVVLDQANSCSLSECTVFDCQNNGVRFAGAVQCSLQGSTLRRISLHAGMGRPTDGNSFGVLVEGSGNQISGNRILDVGYIGIGANGPVNRIELNYVARYCLTKDDGGGIYVSGYGPAGTQGTYVEHNMILHGRGAGAGAYPPNLQAAHGVYIDDFATEVTVAHNTAAHCGSYGIFVHNAADVTLRDNTCFANGVAQLAMIEDSIASTDIRGAVVEGNVFCAREESAIAAEWSSERDDIQQFGAFAGNAYVNLYRDSGYLKRLFRTASQVEQVDSMDLAEWQSVTGHDLSSTASPFSGALPLTEAYTFLEPERIGNGGFMFNLSGWGCWILGGGGNNCTFDWTPGGVLDGGSARLGFDAFTGSSYAVGFQEIGPVVLGQRLLCQFSVVGARVHAPLTLELRQDGSSGYDPLSTFSAVETDPSREEHSVRLDVTQSDPNARIDFGLEESTEAVWLDNVSVRAVQPNEAGLKSRVRLFINPTQLPRTVKVGDRYVTVDGAPLPSGGQLVLGPLEGRVMIRL